MDVDFFELTNLARGSDSDSKPKRALERGGSDAKLPVAKAKSSAIAEEFATAAARPVPTRLPEPMQAADPRQY